MSGAKLNRAMIRAGWTTQELADRLAVSYETVKAWRAPANSRRPCCPWMIRELERVLKITGRR